MPELKRLDHHQDWLAWTQENLARGCDPAGVKAILLQNAFDPDSVEQVLAQGVRAPKAASAPMVYHARAVLQQGAPVSLALGPLERTTSGEDRGARNNAQPVFLQDPANPFLVSQVITPLLQLYVLVDFLSPSECQGIIDLGQGHLRASTVSLPDQDAHNALPGTVQLQADQTYVDLSFRTSQTCDLALLQHPWVDALDRKISIAMGLPMELSEGTQLQRYRVGEQFKAHTDYFTPQSEEYAKFAAIRGNRTWTFMVYLNEVEQGGGTHFVAINKTIRPRQGMAVVWNNLTPSGDVNPQTLHAGMTVLEGEKFVITKWFRQR